MCAETAARIVSLRRLASAEASARRRLSSRSKPKGSPSALAASFRMDLNELTGITKWIWANQERIHKAENGGSAADTDRQRYNSGQRKRRSAAHCMPRKTEVLNEDAHNFFRQYTLVRHA